MNEKALVEIFLPASNKSYDVYVPLSCKMGEILLLVSKVINDLSDGNYRATGESVLCDRKSGLIFNINLSAVESGIKNGSHLMLI